MSSEVGPWTRDIFRTFAKTSIAPHALISDRIGKLDPSVIGALRTKGYLGCLTPVELGGLGMSEVAYGQLTCEVGNACSSARTLMTVHHLVASAVLRWGSPNLRAKYAPPLARGELLSAFALSESDAGSDANAIATTIERDGESLVIHGEKRWVSFGQIADLYLVIGRTPNGPTAVLVPAHTQGVQKTEVSSMVGTKAGMMANIKFDACMVPASSIVGKEGFGLSHVAYSALDHGRYSVAWGAVGIAEAAIEFARTYTRSRSQFGSPLIEKPLVRSRLTKMTVAARAARALCMHAGHTRDQRATGSLIETMIAKYAASKAAVFAANEAIQLHGAAGLLQETQVERLLRDAKVTEIIEGSSDLLELILGEQEIEVLAS